MSNSQISIMDLLCEIHAGLERQGPGSAEMTIKALSFLDKLNESSRILDLGCGSGGQTMVLAQNIPGNIIGVDIFPDFISVLNDKIKKQNMQKRVSGIVGSMDNLSSPPKEFDLIWSEGAIDCIGFEKGIAYWNSLLKKGGYLALTCASWFTDERPAEIEKWWVDAVPDIATIGQNILSLQKAGYVPVAAFILPENCWTENYLIPREAAGKALLAKYAGNKTVRKFIEANTRETELYSKYKQFYGYAFYIGKKI